jgi:hypothetical protein
LIGKVVAGGGAVPGSGAIGAVLQFKFNDEGEENAQGFGTWAVTAP